MALVHCEANQGSGEVGLYFGDKDEELERFINEETLREVELGWTVGPLSDTELTETLGPLWIPSRRFAVRQARSSAWLTTTP